ncbi:MAG: hypothetical protein H6828_06910 [Planctomycetes bacterium]|nr:hypothetical protein [Planctomycetota bacterium]
MKDLTVNWIAGAALLGCLAWGGAESAPAPSAEADALVTLYRFDPERASLSFATGRPGHLMREHVTFNDGGQLDFGNYHDDELTVGISGGQSGAIVDLGELDAFRERHGLTRYVQSGSPYAALGLWRGAPAVRSEASEVGWRPVRDIASLFDDDHEDDHAPARLGHLYLARIVHGDGEEDLLVKLLVVAHAPGESVTLRWERLRE